MRESKDVKDWFAFPGGSHVVYDEDENLKHNPSKYQLELDELLRNARTPKLYRAYTARHRELVSKGLI